MIDKVIFVDRFVESAFAGFADKIDLEERKITHYLLAPECEHFDWDIQMRMAFVEVTVDSKAESGGLVSEVLVS